MTNVVVSILAAAAIPTRLVGAVTKSKDGSVTIVYSEPGEVKKQTKAFLATEIVGALAGEAGYVIAMLSTPITKIVGELIVKDGVRIIKTDAGNVALNALPGVTFDVKEVEADSKEARAAERASKVKVRGARARTEAKAAPAAKEGRAARSEKAARPSREERKAAARAAKSGGKPAKTAEAPVKKKKRA